MAARKIGSRYTAHQVLGRGSAGTVWLGEGPDGPVAIKLLREDLASDQELVGRFVQERTALLSLEHPNIVGVRDLVVDGSDLALVMDLVRGTDLRSRLERQGALSPAAAVSIAADVADGLTAAHAAGVVHRDVKPENVLLDSAAPPGPGGAPPARLTDFGIARLVDSPRRTRATRIIGTPDYLAPEIIEGLPPRASVDIYALATVVYELLAGVTPFGGGHPGAVLRRHVTETVSPLPGIPDGLWSILACCLAKAPASRLTAGELAERLREQLPALAGLPPIEAGGSGVAAPERGAGSSSISGYRLGGGPAATGPEADPEAAQPRRAVPLVPRPAPDSSRDTHISLKLPTPEELAAYRPQGATPPGAQRPGGAAGPRGAGELGGGGSERGAANLFRRAAAGDERADEGTTARRRRRRLRLGGMAAALMVASGLGGYGYLATRDAGATTSDDGAEADPAASGTPTAPTDNSVASPQGSAETGPLPSWSEPDSLPRAPVALRGGPRSVATGGATFAFARGEDGNVWYIVRTAAGYGQWVRLTGIHTAGDPAAVSSRPGQLDLFALGTDGLVYRRTMIGGTWGLWSQVDGRTKFDAAPAVASSAPGRIDLVGRTGGDLVTTSLVDGRWNAWALIPTAGRIVAAPGLVSRATGRLDAFVVRRGDYVVLRVAFANGAWRPAQEIEGMTTNARPEPVALPGRKEALYLFAPGRDGSLVQAVSHSAGAAWRLAAGSVDTGTGSALRDSPGASADGKDLELLVRTSRGQIRRVVANMSEG